MDGALCVLFVHNHPLPSFPVQDSVPAVWQLGFFPSMATTNNALICNDLFCVRSWMLHFALLQQSPALWDVEWPPTSNIDVQVGPTPPKMSVTKKNTSVPCKKKNCSWLTNPFESKRFTNFYMGSTCCDPNVPRSAAASPIQTRFSQAMVRPIRITWYSMSSSEEIVQSYLESKPFRSDPDWSWTLASWTIVKWYLEGRCPTNFRSTWTTLSVNATHKLYRNVTFALFLGCPLP